MIFERFLTDLGMLFNDFTEVVTCFLLLPLHLCLVTGDQCSGHGGRGAVGKWIRSFLYVPEGK